MSDNDADDLGSAGNFGAGSGDSDQNEPQAGEEGRAEKTPKRKRDLEQAERNNSMCV